LKRPIDLAKSDAVRQELLSEQFETIKFLIVGHGRVGKTTAIKAVKERTTKHEESTVGMDTTSFWIPEVIQGGGDGGGGGQKGKGFKAQVWDFA